MTKTAVVTGAGSGVGQAIALKLVQQGWRVAITGRRIEALNETVRLADSCARQLLVVPCDVGNEKAVAEMAKQVLAEFKEVEVLVNSAGTNTPKRSLEVLSMDDYHEMIETNLDGAFYCVQAFLPQMRLRRSGTIVNIISEAGRQASPKSGVGYVMSKFGLAGLNQSINVEEHANGIRACAIYPGDIDTPLLARRPQPPDAAARATMLKSEDVADCALLCINLPMRARVEELVIRPR